MSLLVYFSIKSRFLHILCAVFVKKVRSAILKLKKNGFPENNHFSRFSPQNPIIHYSKNPKNVSNWSQNWIRKSKKVIFWSEPSYPEPWSLLVAFSIKSRFLHVFWPVSVKKSPSNYSKSEKKQLFSIFNVDHFSRLLQTQNTPKIFFGRFALKLKKKQFSRFSP